MRSIRMAFFATLLLVLAPAAASAQAYLTPFIGANFGRDTGVTLDEGIGDRSRLDFGVRLGAMSAGIFGGELEVGYTRNFYGHGTIFDSSNVLTVMGNVLLALPAGPVRPYVLAGLGLVRRTIRYAPAPSQPNFSDSRAAYDIGGGATLFLSKHLGINGDLRYVRNFSTGNRALDLPNTRFNYARGSVGLTLRF
jgi:opacity protein-like surface antigen